MLSWDGAEGGSSGRLRAWIWDPLEQRRCLVRRGPRPAFASSWKLEFPRSCAMPWKEIPSQLHPRELWNVTLGHPSSAWIVEVSPWRGSCVSGNTIRFPGRCRVFPRPLG